MERSGQQYAPTVNIVLSYDAEAMIAFQESGDFSAFINHRNAYDKKMKMQMGDKYVPQTHIFNNSPASTFVGLDHVFEGQTGELSVEIMDPQGVFEESMLNNSVDGFLDIKDNPVGSALLSKKEEIIIMKSERQQAREEATHLRLIGGPEDKLKELDENIASLTDTLESLGEEEEIYTDNTAIDVDNLAIINKQIAARTTQFQRPVFITYGCGDSLLDWSPVQSYNKILKIEYSFTGDGVRTLKLIFAGLGIHANLMSGFGVKPFGANFSKGLLTQGVSDQIFNKAAAKQQADTFKNLVSKPTLVDLTGAETPSNDIVDKYIGDPMRPSFHLAVKTAIERFIQNGSNYENVLVMLPNLDEYLSEYFSRLLRSTKWRLRKLKIGTINVQDVVYMKAFEQALEGLGLTLGETLADGDGGVVGSAVLQNLEECGSPEGAEEWFEKRHLYAKMECDYTSMTFLEKLTNVGAAIQSNLNKDAPNFSMMSTIDVEVDFQLLQLMEKAALIPSAINPCVMWGSGIFRRDIIEARLLESTLRKVMASKDEEFDETKTLTSQDLDEFSNTQLKKFVHPIEELLGLDINYMKSVIDHILPVSWIGPFGPQNSGQADDYALPSDANQKNTGVQALRRNQPYLANRMPVFTFGTRNPNILSIDFDINGIFLTGMNMAKSTSLPSQSAVAGIIPDNFKTTADRMFLDMRALDINDLDEHGVPRGFVKLMEPYYESDFWSADEAENFDEWTEIFNELGDDTYKNIGDKKFSNGGGKNATGDFYRFMWSAFQALYAKVKPTPTSIRNLPSHAPSEYAISNSVRFNNRMVNHFLRGKITTTPLFNLSSNRSTLLRSCLLYCIEPRFSTNQDTGSTKANTTWFSGLYEIMGYTHKITTSSAESTFSLARSGTKGAELTKEESDNRQQLEDQQAGTFVLGAEEN